MNKISKEKEKDKTPKNHLSRIFFEPCDGAKQMRMKKHSDKAELELYLNPRKESC